MSFDGEQHCDPQIFDVNTPNDQIEIEFITDGYGVADGLKIRLDCSGLF